MLSSRHNDMSNGSVALLLPQVVEACAPSAVTHVALTLESKTAAYADVVVRLFNVRRDADMDAFAQLQTTHDASDADRSCALVCANVYEYDRSGRSDLFALPGGLERLGRLLCGIRRLALFACPWCSWPDSTSQRHTICHHALFTFVSLALAACRCVSLRVAQASNAP